MGFHGRGSGTRGSEWGKDAGIDEIQNGMPRAEDTGRS
jgi:hypothetical protein